jgi:hypothetical protein
MPQVGFEPATSAAKRPQTYALDRAATGIGLHYYRRSYCAQFMSQALLTRTVPAATDYTHTTVIFDYTLIAGLDVHLFQTQACRGETWNTTADTRPVYI